MASQDLFDAQKSGTASDATSRSFVLYYLGVLRKRFWIIAPVVIIFGTVGLIRAFRTPALYKATAKVFVERNAPALMAFEGQQTEERTSRWDPDFYSTQIELITSRAVLEIALEREPVKELLAAESREGAPSSFLSEFRRTLLSMLGAVPAPPPAPWETIRRGLSAAHVPETHFVEISALDRDPRTSATYANAVAKAYDEYHRRRKIEALGEAFLLLEKEKEKAEAKLRTAEAALQEFRETAEGLSVSETDTDQAAEDRLVKLNEQLTQVQINRVTLSASLAVMNEAISTNALASDDLLFSLPVIQQDRSLVELRQGIATAEKDVAALSQVYGAEHPLLSSAQSQLQVLRDQFRKTLREIILSEGNRLRMLEGEEAELQKRYEEQKQVAINLSKEGFSFTRLRSEVERHRRLYDSLVDKMRQVDVSSGLVKTNVQIIEEASVPFKPTGPGRMRAVLIALCLGLFLGAGLAILVENLDDTIKTPEDLKECLSVPLLGFIPSAEGEAAAGIATAQARPPVKPAAPLPWKERLMTLARRTIPGVASVSPAPLQPIDEAERRRVGQIVISEPGSSVTESYRAVRANLFYSLPAKEVRLLAFTSCQPQEGKTTSSCNIALSIAQTGKRVLLIDGDLHRPSVHRVFGLPNSNGISSVLVGESRLSAALQPIPIEGAAGKLDILPAGPSSPNPSELLGSERMRALLDEVRASYDWVLIDTPPVLFVTDAIVLGALCDGLVFVVKAGSSTRSLLRRAVEQVTTIHTRIVGTVLNNTVISSVGRNYSYYHRYGYSRYARDYRRSYYSDESAEPAKPAQEAEAAVAPATPRAEPPPHLALAEDALAKGELAAARTHLESAVAHPALATRGWELTVWLLLDMEDADGLQSAIAKLASGKSKTVAWAMAEAALNFLKGRPEIARTYVEHALELQPESLVSRELQARILARQGQTDAAAARLRALRNEHAGDPGILRAEAEVLVLSGKIPPAEAFLRTAVQRRRTPGILVDLATVIEQSSPAESEALLREAIAQVPQRTAAREALGRLLLRLDRASEAEAVLREATDLPGAPLSATAALARALHAQGRSGEAGRLAARLVESADVSVGDRDAMKEILGTGGTSA